MHFVQQRLFSVMLTLLRGSLPHQRLDTMLALKASFTGFYYSIISIIYHRNNICPEASSFRSASACSPLEVLLRSLTHGEHSETIVLSDYKK